MEIAATARLFGMQQRVVANCKAERMIKLTWSVTTVHSKN